MRSVIVSMFRPAAFTLVGATLCVIASSCAVGPNYQRPDVNAPAAYKSATTQEAERPKLAADWWRLFGDPALDRLERDAIAYNTDLQAAMARVVQARAAAGVTASAFYPQVTLDPSIQRSRTSGNRTSGGGSSSVSGVSGSSSSRGRTTTDVRVPLDVSYEVDVWGRVRRLYEASLAGVRASEADYQVVLQTLEADVAQNYFSLRSLDAQAAILQKTVESYQKQIELTQTQRRAGLVGQTDVAQAQTLLNTAVAQQVDVRRQRADVEHALAILLGRSPAELSLANAPLDLTPPTVPAGLPVDLLRARPDVAEAEEQLAAASAQIGVAVAAFYPQVRLTGAAGFESVNLSKALDWESRVWSIGPSVSFPIFLGGQLRANLEQVRARYDELLANYRGRVLAAFRDVEDSLTDLHLRADEARAQDEAVRYAREYLRLSELQYRGGLTNYLQVIDAERSLLNSELSVAQLLNQRMASTVLLIKSLGGGWDPQAPLPATLPAPTTLPTTTQAVR